MVCSSLLPRFCNLTHISALEAIGLSDLNDGQKISYNIESNKGKISAIDIKLI